jgi:glycosyltransferase involved in cell wall biosynthesis
LFATDHIHFPQGGGGGEKNTHELCLGLDADGCSPAVMSSLVANHSFLSLVNRARSKLPPWHSFPSDAVCGYPVYRGWAQDGAGEVVRRFRPDIVVVQSTKPAHLLHSFTSYDVPVLAYFHEVAEIAHLSELAGTSIPILANSAFTAQRLHTACGLYSTVIRPIIHPKLYHVESRREKVLFINTVPRKGLELAFGLAAARPDIQFDFVLSWILTQAQVAELTLRAKTLGNIILHRPTQDMRPLYARARIVLAPSQWEETWGRVATEAHVSGIPVLGSDRGGLPEAIGPGGITLPFDERVSKWAAALGVLWDNEEAYAGYARAALQYATRSEIQPGAIISDLRKALEAGIHKAKVQRKHLY